jgi:hypothetical protein
MRYKTWIASMLLSLFAGVAVAADTSAVSPEGLVEVKSKRLDAAYLAPGADFRPYTKLMVDPTQTAFRKDWMKNMNDRRDLSRMISSEQAQQMLEGARTNFAEVFTEVFTKAGYTIVDTPGPDVLRVTPGLVNLYVNAPDVMAAGRSTSYTANAGEATMILELRDSQTNALLGRVFDRRETRDSVGLQAASRVTNVQDFRMLFRSWANICVEGLATLKEVSPLPETLTPGQKLD